MKAGVVGRPVAHSLSPLIHGAWLKAAGAPGDYRTYRPAEDMDFAAFVGGLRREGLAGVNVTLPFKEAALALADRASPRAEAAGAANLLLFRPGVTEADNTDGLGLMRALRAAGLDPKAGPAVLLGAGGAARGALAALLEAGAPEVRIVNRTTARAEALAALRPGARAAPWRAAGEALADAAVLVNATSLGMSGQPALDLDLGPLPREAVVMDMVYKPLETPLLAQARARGLRTADGLAMLIGQAAPSFEALFGRPVPREVDVRSLCEAAL